MSLTFTERKLIREARSQQVKSKVQRFNIADLELRELCGGVLDENERAALMLSRGVSIMETARLTGCPKCRVEKIRQSIMGKNKAKPRSFYEGLDSRVYELRGEGLSYSEIGRCLGVTHRFTHAAWVREHRRRNEQGAGGVQASDAVGDLESVA